MVYFIALFASVSALVCDIYRCGSDRMFNSENECILFTQGAYQVRGCTNSTDFCNVPLSLTPDAPVLCTPIPEFNITTVFPGEICAKT